jgi:hypothetical protein
LIENLTYLQFTICLYDVKWHLLQIIYSETDLLEYHRIAANSNAHRSDSCRYANQKQTLHAVHRIDNRVASVLLAIEV